MLKRVTFWVSRSSDLHQPEAELAAGPAELAAGAKVVLCGGGEVVDVFIVVDEDESVDELAVEGNDVAEIGFAEVWVPKARNAAIAVITIIITATNK